MKIKRIGSNDSSDFFELYKNIVSESFTEWTKESKNHWLKEDYSPKFWEDLLKKNEFPVFVAFTDDKMVGFSAVEGIDYGVVYLGWIGVLKSHQRQGIGDKLMQETINWCGEQDGLHKIELETQIKELQPFYEKHGFVLEGVRKKSWQKLDNYMFGKIL